MQIQIMVYSKWILALDVFKFFFAAGNGHVTSANKLRETLEIIFENTLIYL